MEAQENQGQNEVQHNLIIGRIQLSQESSFDPGLADWMQRKMQGQSNMGFSDPSGYWAKYFAPQLGVAPACLVPGPWANFFTAILLSPNSFNNAKEMLKTTRMMAALDDQNSTVGFQLPAACPIKAKIVCLEDDELNLPADQKTKQKGPLFTPSTMNETIVIDGGIPEFTLGKNDSFGDDTHHNEILDQGNELAMEPENGLAPVLDPSKENSPPPGKKKSAGRAQVVVDSEVRRSPRLKGQTGGFMKKQCTNKACLGCNSSPPVLSLKSVRKIGASMCGLDPMELSDEILLKKMKTAPVGKTSVGKAASNEDDDADKD
jgi:hypothetical protein